MPVSELNARIAKAYAQPLVFGSGDVGARLMLIGEAPGKDEIAQGKPFVGKAGQNLSHFLEILQLTREEIYITNVCKFRPVRISAKNTVSNRTPARGEIVQARPFLMEEIELIDPEWVVTLGNIPLQAVRGDAKLTIGHVHGQAIDLGARKHFALYHPASVIYNRSLLEVYEQDLLVLRGML